MKWGTSMEDSLQIQEIDSKMAEKTEDENFTGIAKKMRIVSNNTCFGLHSEPTDEIEQHLTISNDGRVWFSAYAFGEEKDKYTKVRGRNFSIDRNTAQKMLNKVANYFQNEYTETLATDIGDWFLELTNNDGTICKFRGSLWDRFYYEDESLSDVVRETLGMDGLYVFDGKSNQNKIMRVMLEYQRMRENDHQKWSQEAELDLASEQLLIDRATGTIEYSRNIRNKYKVYHKYEVKSAVKKLLNYFSSVDFFAYIAGAPEDAVDEDRERRDYKITIDYEKSSQQVLEGSFNRDELPKDFADFAETIADFLIFYGLGEILDPLIYKKAKKRSTYIFCSVIFAEGRKTYYQLTDDISIEVGDVVLVPAGIDNHEAIVKVVKIEHFREEDCPLPLEMTKSIIRKCTEEELILQAEEFLSDEEQEEDLLEQTP